MSNKIDDASRIDWAKMAAPQDDQYDTQMVMHLATTTASPLRKKPYVRREPGNAPACCQGKIALRPYNGKVFSNPQVVPADLNHPNIEAGTTYLATWPAAYTQFCTLMDTIHPYTDLVQAKEGDRASGSSSHSFEQDFGSIILTIDDPIGMAQAMVHEMAHQKLRAMGVSFECAERLITNSPSEMFDSPIRKDKKRPMTAVFHAQYSFIHVTALDLYMLREAKSENERNKILRLLERNVPRMRSGQEEITTNLRTDAEGMQFVNAFMRWSEEVLCEGETQLKSRELRRSLAKQAS